MLGNGTFQFNSMKWLEIQMKDACPLPNLIMLRVYIQKGRMNEAKKISPSSHKLSEAKFISRSRSWV
jgi:hypothetical protein